MTQLIGIVGCKGAGKDTFADIFKLENAKKNVVSIAFADALKEMLVPIGFPRSILWGSSEGRDTWVHPHLQITCRKALKTLGDQVGRQMYSPDIWVWLVEEKIRYLNSGCGINSAPDLIIVRDCRYSNEHSMLKRMGARTFLIRRPQVDDGDDHPSENWARRDAIAVVDEVIENNDTFEKFILMCELYRNQILGAL